ncbi:GTP-binding protein [Micromonospora sp. WP24]|uniref:GTPase n=1 Tax=Micromonospora sp. WP24 TaxID=2604469 RepID=UPI0011D687E1|nr:GTPase [Micromonospora sp. WP24]TYB91848.1 GTP-binding protein [Micromonospora sp. WP24]
MTTEVVSLEDAVRAAVEQGHAELTRLDAITDDLVGAFAHGQRVRPSSSDLVTRLDDFTRRFPRELRRHLDRERESLGSFNIAFFGRTGVGKSTLLSAFGRLDGEYVSPGVSDWTTEVRPIEWRDCRLFDTPGINGWGRTESRDDLEAKARRAVEIADIVLLCFDNQSQQEMEFEKIAAWIRDHGKPVVAVLNVRNARWRHPARVPEVRRRNLSESVRQHTDNIRTQLVQIGLPDTPVVAIHSRRALFARATTPFQGPAQKDFHHEREEFGKNYLDRWSNFGTLERLIVASIAEGGADLRLAALREDIRSRCRRGIGELEDLAVEIEQEVETLEREVESLFAVLGYPEDAERSVWLHDVALSADLVDVSEQARGRPYTSPVKGSLDRFVRHLAASHLAGCRRQAKANADDLIRRAFDEHTVIDESKFTEVVFDQAVISAAAEAVWADRRAFLQRELEVAVEHESFENGTAVSHAALILGDEGGDVAGDVVRGAGIAVGVGALAVPALALFWNPVGWVLGAAAAGVGIVGQVQQHLGKKMSERASERARKAQAQAVADCHRAVDQTFVDYEDALVRDSREAAWTLLAPVVGESLRAAIELRLACSRIARLIDDLQTYAGSIKPAPAVTDVLLRAQRRMGESPAEVTRALLGEDWLESGIDHQPAQIDHAVHEAYSRRREEDRTRLTRVIAAAWSTPSTANIHAWRDDLEDAARRDPALFDIARTFWRVNGARPALAVLGDYNSGKSSLIRRIMVDSGRRPHAAFDIRAAPATTAANRYQLPRIDLVDTPGLQSGHDQHDSAAFEAIADAALVLVVVHINLLIGDTSMLEELARGSKRIAAKGGRMVFLVNRCDELGVNPLTAPEAFLNLQDRKREELRAAFAARSIDVEVDKIHCLSGDPFGLMGGDATAEPVDFDENRLWDGVTAFTSAISGLSDEQLSAAASSAAFDAAVTDLKRHQQTLHQVQVDGTEDLRRSEPVIATLRAAVNDAVILEGSLREDVRRMVDRHTVATKSAVAELDRKDGQKLENLVDSWWKAPQFEADLERYLADAARKLDEWHSDHTSAIGREMRAAEFQVAPEFAAGFKAQGSAWHEDLTEGAGNVAGAAASLAKALGNRDAVYAIGKQLFDHKFKPWGAVKGGAHVARVGIVLGAVATALDVAAMVNDSRKAEEHKRQQESALQEIDKAAAEIVEQIMRGEQGEGPVGYLQQGTRELETLLDEYLDLTSSIRERMDSAKARAEAVEALIEAADELIGTPGRNG